MGVAVSQKKWLVRSRRTHDHWQNKVWNLFLMLHLSVDLISYPIQLIDVDRICYGQVTWEQWLMVIPPSWMGFLLMGILIANIGLMTISLCAYVNQLLTMAHVCWFLLHPWTSSNIYQEPNSWLDVVYQLGSRTGPHHEWDWKNGICIL